MTVDEEFRRWWENEGSGMTPRDGEDREEHVRRVSRVAWLQGHYTASTSGVDL